MKKIVTILTTMAILITGGLYGYPKNTYAEDKITNFVQIEDVLNTQKDKKIYTSEMLTFKYPVTWTKTGDLIIFHENTIPTSTLRIISLNKFINKNSESGITILIRNKSEKEMDQQNILKNLSSQTGVKFATNTPIIIFKHINIKRKKHPIYSATGTHAQSPFDTQVFWFTTEKYNYIIRVVMNTTDNKKSKQYKEIERTLRTIKIPKTAQ